MGVVSCRRWSGRRRLAAALLAIVLFTAAMVVTAGRPIRLPAAALTRRRIDSSALVGSWTTEDATPARRRWLVGPGSSPPTCHQRCGRCTPCKATRVAIQPGIGPQWEYYPEVWRCKCGNKLFMP
ncbi:EPIDERMAL PATTERNING FACTOR-like protein 4 [Phragmites australis]|uniref:EPIDERMAL PATTERNING FACTOR-like protein 4 n=1 Tax=Phragmites australis TaxID=29695 RepID=UPI002D78235E|nr:EPIDERMAL PATTERNING FACTOR-like protein 4 [Phragmites australis]